MKRKYLLILIYSLIAIFILSAAGQADKSQVQTGVPAIKMISHQSPSLEAISKIMESFGGTNLSTEFFPFNTYVNQVRISLSSKSSNYDVLWGDHQLIQEWAQNGWLKPLDDYIKRYYNDYAFYDIPQTAWDAVTYNGKIYAIPSSSNIWMLYCRTDLFQEAGLKYPPKTLGELTEAARILTVPGERYGFATTMLRGINGANGIDYFLRLFGGGWVDENMNPYFGGDAGMKALNALHELLKYSPKDILTYNNNDLMTAFQQDRVAMGFLWSSRAGGVNDEQESRVVGKVEFFLPPVLSESETHMPLGFINAYAISAYSKSDTDASFRAIAHGTSYDAQMQVAKDALPVRMSALNNPQLRENIPFINAASRAFEVGVKAADAIPQASEYYSIVTAHFQEALSGQTRDSVALSNGIREAKEFLESRR